MPSQTRRLSSRERSAAKKIQTKFRNRKTKKKQVSALQRIENKVRSIKIKNYEKERSRRHEEEVAKFRNISTQRNKRKEVAQKFRTRIKNIINNKKKENVCAICLDKMMPNDNVSITSPCNHKFHSDCIRRSLTATQGICPLCRTVVTNIPYSPRSELVRRIQPPPPPNILDPIQRRQLLDLEPLQLIQHLIVRSQELDVIEQSIERQRELLPDAPEIPNITYEQAVVNEVTANDIETTLRSLYNEAYTLYTNYESFNTQDRPSTNDEIAEQHIETFFNITSNLLEVANYDANNALRISNRLGELARGA